MEDSYAQNDSPTILIVDDQIDNIKVLMLALEVRGYSIAYALSGQETLKSDLCELSLPNLYGLRKRTTSSNRSSQDRLWTL